MNIVIASLYANPLTIAHIRYLKEAAELGHLLTIINNDKQVIIKRGIPFINSLSRLEIVRELKPVWDAIISIDEDESVSKTIEYIYEEVIPKKLPSCKIHNNYFVNGGPLIEANSKELEICKKYNIKPLYGVGGTEKIESSSNLIEQAAMEWIKRNRDKAERIIENDLKQRPSNYEFI